MNKSDKLKGLIDSLKTSNELASKQIEVNKRTIDLLGSLIIEPHEVEEVPTHGANDAGYIQQFTDPQL